MIIKDNRCIIQYKGKNRLLKFEKQLIKLFKDNGFKFIGSGFDMCDGSQDLCFEEIIKGKNKKLKEELIEQSKETAKLNIEVCKEFEHTEPINCLGRLSVLNEIYKAAKPALDNFYNYGLRESEVITRQKRLDILCDVCQALKAI